VRLVVNGIETFSDPEAMCHPSLIRALPGITYTLLRSLAEALGPES